MNNGADAGRQLADELVAADVSADVVLAIPLGGLPIGPPSAAAWTPLNIIGAQKLGIPRNPELVMGAIAENGSIQHNDEIAG